MMPASEDTAASATPAGAGQPGAGRLLVSHRSNIDSLMVISAEMCYDSTRTFTNKTGRPGVISTLPTLTTGVTGGQTMANDDYTDSPIPTQSYNGKSLTPEQISILKRLESMRLRQLQLPPLEAMSYEDYLKSDHWLTIRSDAIARADGRCQVCNSDYRLQVHHRTYARRGHELPGDLTVLCEPCHQLFHKYGKLDGGAK